MRSSVFSPMPGISSSCSGVMSARRLHRRDPGGNQLLDDAFSQFRDLLDRRGRAAGESLHLLLHFLALLFFALDVDLPAQQLGCQPDVLALLADGQRKLRVVHDHFKLLVASGR